MPTEVSTSLTAEAARAYVYPEEVTYEVGNDADEGPLYSLNLVVSLPND